MCERIICGEELEKQVIELVRKYPTGFLSEPELNRWEAFPWAVAIRVPDVDGLDSPKVIIRGSYQEIRAFEIAYERVKEVHSLHSPLLTMCHEVAMEA